jgi:DNA-binding NtrC family response regulator
VDDDPQLRQSFQRLLSGEGHVLKTAASGEAGLDMVREQVPDLAILDVRLPGMDGLETFRRMREIAPKLTAIVMTAYGTTETAIQATKLGAYDYVLKPFDVPDVLELIAKALEAGRLSGQAVDLDAGGRAGRSPDRQALVGRSQPMQELFKAIGRAAPTDATVLIRGESGTGKELVARAVYQHSLRAAGPFLVINCVAIPETLLESELFGYEKGAFTGAVARRVGKIEQAHQGTVLLDEIGDMPMSIQAKILRLLEERQIERLGGRSPVPVDVRILAATNRDLEQAVAQGAFREDLYYRLNVVTLHAPPLREREGDVPLLAEYFLERYSAELGVENPGLEPEAARVLAAHSWPGNVRELANVVHKALIFNRGGPLAAGDVLRAVEGGERCRADARDAEAEAEQAMLRWVHQALEGGGADLFDTLSDHFCALVVREALELTGGNRTKAAKLLGLSRPTLQARIEKYGLKIETSVRR